MNAIQNTVKMIEVGRPTTFAALTIYPLTGLPAESARFTVLDDALSAGTARITEVSESGSVSEVAFINDDKMPVLLLDGEEIAGAKQNRIVNLTLLAPPMQKTIIPVSCVEAGRWASESREFRSTPQVMYSMGRMRKSANVSMAMAQGGKRTTNQGEVWEGVDELAGSYNVKSQTARMGDVFDSRRTDIEDFVNALPSVEGQVGAVFALAGRVSCVEFFDCAETLAKMWPKLVRSWAMDALRVEKRAFEVQPVDAAVRFLKKVALAETSQHNGVGLGEDWRFDRGGELNGGALVWEKRVVHLCVFKDGSDGNGGERRRVRGGMARASRRRG